MAQAGDFGLPRVMGKIERLGYEEFQWTVGDINQLLSNSCSEVRAPVVLESWMGSITLTLQCESHALNLRVDTAFKPLFILRFPILVTLVNCKTMEIHIFYISTSIPSHEIKQFVQRNMMTQPMVYDFKEPLTIKIEVKPALANIFKIPLHLELSNFVDKSDLSDVKINVEGTTLHAHKVILSAASSFFADRFQRQTTEAQPSVMDIKYLTPGAVKEMLRFIYTGKIENIAKHKRDLLSASEKFDLPKLKSECVKYMIYTMSVENVPEYLELADLYKCPELQIRLKEFADSRGLKINKQPRHNSLALTMPDSTIQEVNHNFFSPE